MRLRVIYEAVTPVVRNMKKKPSKLLEKCRVTKGALKSDKSLGNNGLFIIPHKNMALNVVVSDQFGWDHVSVSLVSFVPTWSMMCFIKNLFWDEDEVVIQYHPKKEDCVNFHPHCLHLWKPQGLALPTPPTYMV